MPVLRTNKELRKRYLKNYLDSKKIKLGFAFQIELLPFNKVPTGHSWEVSLSVFEDWILRKPWALNLAFQSQKKKAEEMPHSPVSAEVARRWILKSHVHLLMVQCLPLVSWVNSVTGWDANVLPPLLLTVIGLCAGTSLPCLDSPRAALSPPVGQWSTVDPPGNVFKSCLPQHQAPRNPAHVLGTIPVSVLF